MSQFIFDALAGISLMCILSGVFVIPICIIMGGLKIFKAEEWFYNLCNKFFQE